VTKKKPAGEQKKRGRKSLYNPNKHPQLAGALAAEGKTDKQIAEAIGISEVTLLDWRKKYPEFLRPIRAGKDQADDRVEQAVYSRAIGMKITEKKVIQNPDGTTRKEITEKEIPPDTNAGFGWLKIRRPQVWRDAQNGSQVDIQVLIQETQKMDEIIKEALRSELDPEACNRVIAYIEKCAAAIT
jgi:hypothetical protein